MNLKSILSLSAAFAASVLAQDDVVSRCRTLGFTEFANELELYPQLVDSINERSDTTVWAVPNAMVLRKFGNSTIHKRSAADISSHANHQPPTPYRRKRQLSRLPASNAETLFTYLEDPAFVNLGPGQPGRLVSSYVGSSSPAEAKVKLASGLGRSNRQTSGPFKFDKGIIYGVDDFFTLPSEFSTSIQTIGTATMFHDAVVAAGRKNFFDLTTACTVFAPVDAGIKAGKEAAAGAPGRSKAGKRSSNKEAKGSNEETKGSNGDNKGGREKGGNKIIPDEYIICGFLGYSPQLLPGRTYYTVAGTEIRITFGKDGLKRVNGIPFVQTDIITKNGVLHLIKSPL